MPAIAWLGRSHSLSRGGEGTGGTAAVNDVFNRQNSKVFPLRRASGEHSFDQLYDSQNGGINSCLGGEGWTVGGLFSLPKWGGLISAPGRTTT